MIYKRAGLPFDINAEHRIDQINYPHNWFQDASNRAAMGITEEADPAPPVPTQAELDALYAVNYANNISALWQAAHDYEYAQISGVAVGLLVLGVLQSKPKAYAVQMWSKAIWVLYYARKPTITDVYNPAMQDFSSVGPIPYSIPELMAELGM